ELGPKQVLAPGAVLPETLGIVRKDDDVPALGPKDLVHLERPAGGARLVDHARALRDDLAQLLEHGVAAVELRDLKPDGGHCLDRLAEQPRANADAGARPEPPQRSQDFI